MRRIVSIGLLTLVTVTLFVRCSSESYPGLEYDNPNAVNNGESPDNDDMGRTPVRVFVNEQSFYSLAANPVASREDDTTRGVGPFQVEDDDDIENKLANGTLTEEEKLRMDLKYQNTHFYIYAFRNKEFKQQESNPLSRLTLPPNLKYYQLAKNGPSGYWDEHRQDCLVDGYDYNHGLPATLEGDEEDETGLFNLETEKNDMDEHSRIYYSDYGNVGYNFFAYSIGDQVSEGATSLKWGTPQREDDRIYYKNFEVDGSQDVMCGYAPPLDKVLFTRYKKQNASLTESERDMILNIGAYCTFAAHRGIDPQVNIHHQLARFQFLARPGDESASNTTIDAIYVRCHNKGDFVVAHRDTTQVGFYPYEDQWGETYLHEKPVILYNAEGKAIGLEPSKIHDTSTMSADELTDDMIWRVFWDDSYWIYNDEGRPIGKKDINQRGDPLVMGDNMLVPESEELDIYIKSSYKLGEPDQRTFVSHYTINAADLVKANPSREKYYLDDVYFEKTGEKRYIFKKGYYYTVTLVVYGLSQIKVYANISSWVEGDQDISVGEDDFNME